MNLTSIVQRTIIATVVALSILVGPANLVLLSAPSVAEAAPSSRSITTPAPQLTAPMKTTAAAVQGGSTGDGPASEADCEKFALRINSVLFAATRNLQGGRASQAADQIKIAQDIQSQGEDQGCFFVNPV